ncbi:MAG: hypothetical protein NC253_01625 [Ruminococcus sp.]|nr:hypothetical protein [Ruminococcus sp.]MCM1381841.1 hypothetical protein [Muribaculaceae bacterium]MCM1478858.1 hypothetical protein [Muribaculaceae bacterium]
MEAFVEKLRSMVGKIIKVTYKFDFLVFMIAMGVLAAWLTPAIIKILFYLVSGRIL